MPLVTQLRLQYPLLYQNLTDAAGISFNNPAGTPTSESTVEGALNFLANQFFVQTSAPHQARQTWQREIYFMILMTIS